MPSFTVVLYLKKVTTFSILLISPNRQLYKLCMLNWVILGIGALRLKSLVKIGNLASFQHKVSKQPTLSHISDVTTDI